MKKKLLTTALQVGVLVVILFSIGLLTRFPAKAFHQYFALHAVLAAPFYALTVKTYLEGFKRYFPLAVASGVYALILGSLQLIMGVSTFLPALLGGLLYVLLKGEPAKKRAVWSAFVYAVSCYPITLMASVFLGSGGLMSGMGLFTALVLWLVSVGLSILAVNIPLPRVTQTKRA